MSQTTGRCPRVPARAWIVGVAGLMLLASCEYPDVCSQAEAFEPPDNLEPVPVTGQVTNTTPTLTWTTVLQCQPEAWAIDVTSSFVDEQDFLDHIVLTATSDDMSYDWPSGQPLDPGSHYWWRVATLTDGVRGAHGFGFFFTGPPCTQAEHGAPPAPTLLTPADGSLVDLSPAVINLSWDTPTPCQWEYSYEISFDDTFAHKDRWATVYGTRHHQIVTSDYDPPGSEDPIEACLEYFWRVRVELPGVNDGPWSNTFSFTTSQFDGGPCLATAPFLPQELPSEVRLPIPSDAFCREGPNIQYNPVVILPAGSEFIVLGRNEEATWWWGTPEDSEVECWVADSVVGMPPDPLGMPPDPLGFPVIAAPPLPGAGEVDCRQFTDVTSCTSHAECQWLAGRSGGECTPK